MPNLAAPLTAASAALLTPLQALAMDMPSAPDWMQSEEAKQLGIYFAQTAISWGVPGAVALVIRRRASMAVAHPAAWTTLTTFRRRSQSYSA